MLLVASAPAGTRQSSTTKPLHHRPDLKRLAIRHLYFTVTAYVVNRAERYKCDTFTKLTKTGTRAMRGTVAVDPSVVPFGSHLVIPGYGHGRARDTGGAIIGHKLDVAVMSCGEAFSWGRRRVLVAISR